MSQITISFASKDSGEVNGAIHWMRYVMREVAGKLAGTTVQESPNSNAVTLVCSDSKVDFSLSADHQTFHVNLSVKATKLSGDPTKAMPIPGLVILMVIIHLLPGRANAGRLIRFKAQIGDTSYSTDAEVKLAYARLKELLPPEWYLPYAEGVLDHAELFKTRK